MKVLVQDTVSQKYLKGEKVLTDTPDEADDFGFTEYAYEFGRRNAPGEFDVVFYFPEEHCAIKVLHGNGRSTQMVG